MISISTLVINKGIKYFAWFDLFIAGYWLGAMAYSRFLDQYKALLKMLIDERQETINKLKEIEKMTDKALNHMKNIQEINDVQPTGKDRFSHED